MSSITIKKSFTAPIRQGEAPLEEDTAIKANGVTTGKADNFTRDGATLYGAVNITDGEVRFVAIRLGISEKGLALYDFKEVVKNKVDFSFDITGLESGKTYYYQAFAGVDGLNVDGEIKTFTMP